MTKQYCSSKTPSLPRTHHTSARGQASKGPARSLVSCHMRVRPVASMRTRCACAGRWRAVCGKTRRKVFRGRGGARQQLPCRRIIFRSFGARAKSPGRKCRGDRGKARGDREREREGGAGMLQQRRYVSSSHFVDVERTRKSWIFGILGNLLSNPLPTPTYR